MKQSEIVSLRQSVIEASMSFTRLYLKYLAKIERLVNEPMQFLILDQNISQDVLEHATLANSRAGAGVVY
jgi:hypothetical protein